MGHMKSKPIVSSLIVYERTNYREKNIVLK